MDNSKVKKRKISKATIFASFLILLGISLIALFVKNTLEYSNKNSTYNEIEAKVVKHTYKDGNLKATVLEYTIGENTYTVEANLHENNIKTYGSKVKLKYNPSNPQEIIVADQKPNHMLSIGGLASIILGVSTFIVLLLRRIKRITNKITLVEEAPIYNPDIIKEKKKRKKKEKTPKPIKKELSISEEIQNFNNNNQNSFVTPIEETKNNQIIDIPFMNNENQVKKDIPTYNINTNFVINRPNINESNTSKQETIEKPIVKEEKEEIKTNRQELVIEPIKINETQEKHIDKKPLNIEPDIVIESFITKVDDADHIKSFEKNTKDPNNQKLKELISDLNTDGIPSFIPKNK